jgi:hypothetical protein
MNFGFINILLRLSRKLKWLEHDKGMQARGITTLNCEGLTQIVHEDYQGARSAMES